MKKLAVLFCIYMIIFGCTGSPKIDIAAETNMILDIENQWIAANRSRNVEQVMTFFSPEIVMMFPNTPNYKDLQSIRELYVSMFADTTYLWETFSSEVDKIEVAASGDLAYLWGVGGMKVKTPEGITESAGRWVEIYKKINEQWKCALAISIN